MAERYEQSSAKYKAMIYGEAGAGKTRLAATAALDPRLSPALMLEAFGNPISLGDYPKIPDIISLADMEDFNPVYEWITNGQKKNTNYCREFDLNPPYKTLIIDGLTEVQRFVMRKIQGSTAVHPGDLTPSLGRQGFGQLLGTMINWAVHFVGLDMNVIITSLEKSETNPTYAKPLLWGQSGNELCGYVYQVVRLTTQLSAPRTYMQHEEDPVDLKNTNNVALFRKTALYYAKDQYGLTVEHMTDPTLAKILDLIERSRTDPA